MSGRAETSTTLQAPNQELASSPVMQVALIGPNDAHRRTVAKALAGAEGRSVREFRAYPATQNDLQRFIDERFDVVLIDVDTDESYALRIMEIIAAAGTSTAMAYSARNDQNLVMRCMRAGARDFLPLPEQAPPASSGAPESLPETSLPPVADVRQFPPSHEPMPAQPAVPQSNRTPELSPAMEPTRKTTEDAVGETQTPVLSEFEHYSFERINPGALPVEETGAPAVEPTRHSRSHVVEIRKPEPEPPNLELEPAPTDFDAWDATWVRGLQPNAGKSGNKSHAKSAPPMPKPEPVPVPIDARKSFTENVPVEPDSELPPLPSMWLEAIESESAPRPRPHIDPGPVEPLFSYIAPEEKPDHRVVKWIALAMLLGVVVCAAVLYFVHPFSHPAQTVLPAPVPQQSEAQPTLSDSASQAAALSQTTPAPVKPSPATRIAAAEDPDETSGVSSPMMDAQLSAPSRISADIKERPAPANDEPPTAFTPGTMDSGSAMPGSAFGSQSKVSVVPVASRISAGVAEGMLIRRTEPVYPQIAKISRVSGTVVLGATITRNGTISDLHVISGPTMLRDAAMLAVRNWRYRPYKLNNEPVEVETTINVVFNMGN